MHILLSKKNILLLFITLYIASCKTETPKQECNCDLLNKNIDEISEKNYNSSVESTKLVTELRSTVDTTTFYKILDFRNYFVYHMEGRMYDRITDLLLCNHETTSRSIADTLTYIKSVCDIKITNNFISNGFDKIIEADLDYYEIEIQGELYQKYGKGLNIELKKYWRKNYNKEMTLGEVIVLLKKINFIINENYNLLERNAINVGSKKI